MNKKWNFINKKLIREFLMRGNEKNLKDVELSYRFFILLTNKINKTFIFYQTINTLDLISELPLI